MVLYEAVELSVPNGAILRRTGIASVVMVNLQYLLFLIQTLDIPYVSLLKKQSSGVARK